MPEDGRNRPSGRNVKRPAIRAWGQYHSRVIGSMGGECGCATAEKAVPFPSDCPSIPNSSRVSAALNLLRRGSIALTQESHMTDEELDYVESRLYCRRLKSACNKSTRRVESMDIRLRSLSRTAKATPKAPSPR